MNQTTTPIIGPTFADFIYAVVVGVAFSYIKLTDSRGDLLPFGDLFLAFFLLLVVLEDFFLYQTQVKRFPTVFTFGSFRSMLFEVGILLAWFLSFQSRSDATNVPFVLFSAFFLLK